MGIEGSSRSRAKLDEAVRTAFALGDAASAAQALGLAGELEEKRLQLVEALRCYESARHALAQLDSSPKNAAGPQLKALEARVQTLAEALGAEAFARIEKAARGR